jgi:heme exporter protein D
MTVIADWLSMGGYAAFVWPAYGLTGVVLGALAVHSWLRHRRSGLDLDRLQSRSGTGA